MAHRDLQTGFVSQLLQFAFPCSNSASRGSESIPELVPSSLLQQMTRVERGRIAVRRRDH